MPENSGPTNPSPHSLGFLSRWRARLTGPTARMGVVAVADQALVSGTNFVTAILLARLCTKEEFGAYVLALSVLFFLNGIQTALITGPMMVLGAAKEHDEFRRYVTALGVFQLVVAAGAGLLALAVAGVMALTPAGPGLRGAFLGMSAAIFFVQGQDFCRRVLFTRLKPGRVLANDIVFCTIRLVGVVLLAWMDSQLPEAERVWLTGRNAFFCHGVAATVGLMVGLWQLRGWLGRTLEGAREALRENWGFGKWGLGGTFGQYSLTYAANFAAALFGGTAATANLEAPRLLVAPVHMLIQALMGFIPPHLSRRLSQRGPSSLALLLRHFALLLSIPVLGYLIVVAVFCKIALVTALGEQYADKWSLLLLWLLLYAVLAFRSIPVVGLAVLRRPDLTMLASIFLGMLSVLLTPVLGWIGQEHGVLAARLICELLLLAVTLVWMRRELRGG